ncbi:hypothetical protein [Streptobacillus moniliformis]|uniref:hypothetical protein n=1 Tax=Streptobacillus moniliformis TaxID=34105 RepID=UPI000AC467EA|nr:hypothetical protein [Streptobacillus moniliformis]
MNLGYYISFLLEYKAQIGKLFDISFGPKYYSNCGFVNTLYVIKLANLGFEV